MAKRGSNIDFREGLGLLRAAFRAEAEAAKPKPEPAPPKAVLPFSPPRPAAKPQSAAGRQSQPQPAAQTKVGSPKSKVKRPPPRLGPTNVPPNPGKYANGVLEPLRRAAVAPARPRTPAELMGAEALTYVSARVDLSAMRGEAPCPTSIDADEAQALQACLHTGGELLHQTPEPDETGYLVGFDFGTSSSKIVVHQPGAGNLAYALTVPKTLRAVEQGLSQEHLWRSVVWYDPANGRLALAPHGTATPIEGFKTGLIQSTGHRMAGGVTHAQAATAYLAMLIAYVVGQHRREAPPGFDRSNQFSRFHFGVPVACKDEAGCSDEFKRVLTAAFHLAPFAEGLDLNLVKEALRDAKGGEAVSADTPFLLFEELAGVIAGYRASPDHRTGPHVIVDVGASTLDVATFHIPDGDHKVLVFMSAVGLLGAEALRAARQVDVPDPTFRAACAQHTRHVLSVTFHRKDADFFPLNGIPKPLLFVGGGRLTDVHDELYSNYPKGLEAPRRTPEPGANLAYDHDTDFARLLLAWGLAQEELDLPQLKPPSEIEDEVRRHRDYRDVYVDKDMC
jgi:hypothetical protein